MKRWARSGSPEVGHLEEETTARLEEIVVVDITPTFPSSSFVLTAISYVEDRAGNIGERYEEIVQQGSVKLVVLRNSTHKKVLVQLICQLQPADRIFINLFVVRRPEKIDIRNAAVDFQLVPRLKYEACGRPAATSLVRCCGEKYSICPAILKTEVDFIRKLSSTRHEKTASLESFTKENLCRVEIGESRALSAGKNVYHRNFVIRFPETAQFIPCAVRREEHIDPAEEIPGIEFWPRVSVE